MASGQAMQAAWKAETSEVGTDFFPTPPELAREMVAIADVRPGDTALEPSAGKGVIAAELLPRAGRVILVESDPHRAEYLIRQYGHDAVHATDFLRWGRGRTKVDVVVMNPPFTTRGDPVAYVAHIEHALAQLDPAHGSLVALAPSTFGPTHRHRAVRQLYARLIGEGAEIEAVPTGHRFGATNIPVTMIRWGRALRSNRAPLRAPAAPRR